MGQVSPADRRKNLLIQIAHLLLLLHSPPQDLADTPIGDLQDAGNVTGSCSGMGQLHNLLPRAVRKGSPIHVDATQLIDPAVAGGAATKQGR